MVSPTAVGRLYLEVPYAERDQAKRLGAQWDPVAQAWWVPDAAPRPLYARWLPPTSDAITGPLVRARLLAITEGCWSCGATTRIVCGLLVEGAEGGFVPFAEDVGRAIAAVVPVDTLAALGIGVLRPRWSRAAAGMRMSNGCVRCGVLQGNLPLEDALAAHLSDDGTYAELAVGTIEVRLPR